MRTRILWRQKTISPSNDTICQTHIPERYVKKFFRQSFLTETKHPSAQHMRLRINISASAADWHWKHSTKVSPVLTSVNVTSNRLPIEFVPQELIVSIFFNETKIALYILFLCFLCCKIKILYFCTLSIHEFHII